MAEGNDDVEMIADEESSHSELEEDDYDLIEENLGVKVQRKKFKRVRRISDDSDDETTRGQGDEREAIAQQLFEGSDNEDDRGENIPAEVTRDHYSSNSEDDYSETDDFIVDDEDQPINESRRHRKRRLHVTDAVVQEAQDIFGVDFDYHEFERYGDFADEDDQDEDGSEYEDETNQHSHPRKKSRKVGKPIHELFEPHELERAGYTEEDIKIRSTDVPERLQTRSVPVSVANDIELDEEADWVFRNAKWKKRIITQLPPPEQSDANWGQDWDTRTAIPGSAPTVVAPGVQTQASNSNWEEDDWDANTTVQTPAPPATNIPTNSSTCPAELSKDRNAIPAPAASVAVDDDWGDDWDKGTAVGGDFVDWKRPAIPPPRPSKPSNAGKTTSDETWAEESWDTNTTVHPSSTQPTPAPPLSTAESASMDPPPQPENSDVSTKITPKIRNTLAFIRKQDFEVPFIAFYRKECFQPELDLCDLWKIYQLDAEFCLLKLRKERLHKLFNTMKKYLSEKDQMLEAADCERENFRIISEDHVERVKEIKTAEELKDMQVYFRVHYGDYVKEMKELCIQKEREQNATEGGELEKPEDENVSEYPKKSIYTLKRKVGSGGAYAKCVRMNFTGSFLDKMGITSEKFAENLRDKYLRHEVEQWHLSPTEVAAEIIASKSLRSQPSDLINTARFMFAVQIANEPLVRQCVRSELFERATISCWPTKQGRRDIDECHPCFTMKYLKEKPVKTFKEDQFLKLTMAEKDRLIEISIGETFDYVDEIKSWITRDEFSKTVQEWNELREQCLKLALENHLLPALRKELRAKLLKDCHDHILERCGAKLHHWLGEGPIKVNYPDEEEIEWDTSQGVRVMTVVYDTVFDRFGAMVGVVRPDGEPDIRSFRHDEEPSDRLKLENILKYKSPEKDEDKDLLKDYIRDMKPHAVVIAGESRDAMRLQQDVTEIISALNLVEAFPEIKVYIMDNETAKVYASSKRSINDLGTDYPTLLRQAISLGRRAQDPLLEISQLWNADEDILCLKLHPLQDQVPKELLMERLEIEFINRTSEVGVDINRALNYPHTANVVQFISGLGRRKASALLQKLRQKRRLENRSQLLTFGCMGPKVFLNCAGFIKIDTSIVGDSADTYVEVLDGTRVHPESYEFARRIAVDALHDPDEPEMNAASAVEEIMDEPDTMKLDELSLDVFADSLKESGSGDKILTLEAIREELKEKYRDMRREYCTPDPDDMFHILTKETPESLHVGKLVSATVGLVIRKKLREDEPPIEPIRNHNTGKWQCPYCGKNEFPELADVWAHLDRVVEDADSCPGPALGVRIYLDNGLMGFIPTSKLSDKQVINPEERVFTGQKIHCRITKILVDRFSVECTSRSSDLLDTRDEWKPRKDDYYDKERETFDLDKTKEEEERKKLQQRRQTYVKRVIVHPSFKNVAYKEAEKLMDTMDQGEVIVRPSSKGSDHLTVTWKVTDGVYQHIDVREEGKASAFSLGQSLWIDKDEFEDIDEILARHVTPMAAHARDIIANKYYKADLGGDRFKAEDYLRLQKQKNNNKIHYIFQASKDYPGKFFMSYLPKNMPVHEFVTVTAEGFRFRQQVFDNFNEMLKWFKVHYKDPPPTSTPIMMTTANNYAAGVSQRAGLPFAGYQTNRGNYGGGKDATVSDRSLPHAPLTHHTTPHYSTPHQAFTPYSTYAAPMRQSYDGSRTPGVTPRVVVTPGSSKVTPLQPTSCDVDDDECWE